MRSSSYLTVILSPGATSSVLLDCESEKSLSTGRTSSPRSSFALMREIETSGLFTSANSQRKERSLTGFSNTALKPFAVFTICAWSLTNFLSATCFSSLNQSAGNACGPFPIGSQTRLKSSLWL